MVLYGLKNCDTCRKALKLLPGSEFRDVRADGVPKDVLKSAYAQFGADLINTRSTTWRGLDQVARSKDALELLTEYPTLMKRPLVQRGDHMFLGWTKSVQAELLG